MDKAIHLNESELALVSMVNLIRFQTLGEKSEYSSSELKELGFVRENWAPSEIEEKGLAVEGVVTSFDVAAERAKTELAVDAPFAKGIQKWQLPIAFPGFRIIMTRFPPGTKVSPHVHPNIPGLSRCGQLRVVIVGSINYEERIYRPGDWFFIPNGVPYSFTTDPDVETMESYFYQYTGPAQQPIRFSNFQLSLEQV